MGSHASTPQPSVTFIEACGLKPTAAGDTCVPLQCPKHMIASTTTNSMFCVDPRAATCLGTAANPVSEKFCTGYEGSSFIPFDVKKGEPNYKKGLCAIGWGNGSSSAEK